MKCSEAEPVLCWLVIRSHTTGHTFLVDMGDPLASATFSLVGSCMQGM